MHEEGEEDGLDAGHEAGDAKVDVVVRRRLGRREEFTVEEVEEEVLDDLEEEDAEEGPNFRPGSIFGGIVFLEAHGEFDDGTESSTDLFSLLVCESSRERISVLALTKR